MTTERADAGGEIVDLAARLLAGLARRDPALAREMLPAVLPWVRFLPPGDVDALADEFLLTAGAAASIDSTSAVSQLLTEWRHTAEVYADPELYRALAARPLGDFGAALKPAVV